MASDNEIAIQVALEAQAAIAGFVEVVNAIKEMTEAMKRQTEASGGFGSIFSGLSSILSSVGGSILSFLNPLNLIPNAFGLISGAASLVSGAFSGFMGILSSVGSAITTMIVTPFQLAWSVFTTGIDIVSNLASGFMNLIFNIGNIGQAINTVLTFIQPLIDALGFIKDKFLDIINTTAEFESGMSKVGSVANASAAEMEMLRQAAIRIGADTPLSASQATEALYALASGGMKAKEAIAALEGTAMLATASQADLGYTAQIVSTSLSAFKMSADEAARVANVYSAACNESQLNVTRLGDSMKYVGPVAGQLKMNFEETTAALALMSNAGIMGEQAGTALRAAISNLIAPSRMQTGVMAELGVTIEDLNPKTHSLAQILEILKSKNIETAQAFRLFGEAAGPGMMALLDQGGAALSAMQVKLTGTQTAYTTAAMQMDNFKAAQEQLSGAYESLSITIGGVFTGALKSMTTVLTDVIAGFTEFLNQSGFISAATLTITSTIEGLRFEQFKALNDFLFTLTDSFVSFVAQLIGGTAYMNILNDALNSIKFAVEGLQTGITSTLASLGSWIANFVNSGQAVQIFQTALNALIAAMTLVKEGAVLAGAAVGLAFSALPSILEAVIPIVTTVSETFKNMIANLAAGNISGVFVSLVTGIKTGLTQVIDTLKTNGTQITDFFVKMWDGLKEAWDKTLSPLLKDLFSKLMSFITEQGPGLLKTVSDLLTGIFKSAGETVNQMLPELFKGLSNIGQSLQETGGAMSEVAKAIMAPIAEAMRQGIAALKLIITEGFKAVGEVAKGAVMQLVETFKNELANSSLSEGMKEQFGKMFNDIQTAIRENKLGEALKIAFDALLLAFEEVKPQLQTAFDGIADLIKNSILKALGNAYEDAKNYVLVNFGDGIGTAFGTAIGLVVAGIATKMLLISGTISESFKAIIIGVPQWLSGLAPSVAGVFSSVGTYITTALGTASVAAVGAVMLLGAGIGQAFISMGYEWVGYIATAMITAGGAFVLGVLGWPAAILGVLTAVGLAFYNWLIGHSLIDDLPMWWGEVFDAMIAFFDSMTKPISDAFMAIWNFVAEAITTVTQTATDIGTAIIDAIIAVFNGAVALVSTAFNAVWTFLADVVTFVTDGATQIANGLIDTIVGLINAGAGAIKSAFEAIWTFLSDVGATIADIGKSIGEGLINAIQSAIEVGKSVIESVVNGIVSIAQGAYDQVMSIVNMAKSAASGIGNLITTGTLAGGEEIQTGPGFATGGVISARRGGTQITAGEGDMNEAIVPLPDGRSIPVSFPNMPDFSGLVAAANGGGGNISINFGDVILNNDQDEREFFRKIERTVTDVMRRTRGR